MHTTKGTSKIQKQLYLEVLILDGRLFPAGGRLMMELLRGDVVAAPPPAELAFLALMVALRLVPMRFVCGAGEELAAFELTEAPPLNGWWFMVLGSTK